MGLHRIQFHLLAIAFAGLFFFVSAADAGTIPQFTIMTEEWEPYNFEKEGTALGISVDMLVLMLERAGSTQGRGDIKIFPWARAYQDIQEHPNTILFSMARTAEREEMFKWVGPIVEMEFNVYALKSRNIRINSTEDFRKYKIGTLRDDVTEDLLIEMTGMQACDFEQVSANIQNTKKLWLGRIDLTAYSEDSEIATCKEAGLKPDDFESVFTLGKKNMYYAFHKDTPESLIRIFQKAFDDIRDEGKLSGIFHRYGK